MKIFHFNFQSGNCFIFFKADFTQQNVNQDCDDVKLINLFYKLNYIDDFRRFSLLELQSIIQQLKGSEDYKYHLLKYLSSKGELLKALSITQKNATVGFYCSFYVDLRRVILLPPIIYIEKLVRL